MFHVRGGSGFPACIAASFDLSSLHMDARMGNVARGVLTMVVLSLGCGRESPPASDGDSSSAGVGIDPSLGEGPRLDMGVGTAATMVTVAEGGSDGCTQVQVSVDPVIPTIVLLVDQSSSMTEDFSGQQRWNALYDTLMGANGTVMALQSNVRFGLALYSSEDGNDGPTCPMLTEVPPALDNYDAIDAVYGPASPIDETPTGESHALVAAELLAFNEPGPKAIVVATDGEPDTCAEPNPQNGQPEVITSVQNAFGDGIETFVISVGTEVGQQHLQQVANAGVGKPVDDPSPAPFYVALDAGDLVDAFHEIIGGFISCELSIDGIVDLAQECEGTVLLDGVELSCPVDWHLLDESTLELLGDACTQWKDGEHHALDASWPCGAVMIP